MTAPDDERLHRLFLQAVDLPVDERVRFLEGLTASDPGLAAELDALLDADRRCPQEFLELAVPEPESTASVPDQIGPYPIEGIVGDGGMGVVYRAREAGPLGRTVAVKVLRPELSSTAAAGRFEAEGEALAMMDHPNVARVYDAGTTVDGRLYIAMEFVDGERITSYCDARRLGIDARLDLFLQVCDGVQHAHERGIIHRDLNPSNILVKDGPGRPIAKIIDFGIAKFAGTAVARRAFQTESGMLIGTPEYISPEQLAMRPGAGDTRTDVWALGLLLYELVAGVLPYDVESLRGAGLTGLRTAILEQPLPALHARIRALPESQSAEIARARRTDPRALARRAKGDLSRVAAQAIERDRARRYPSPHELAADVRRHLRLEPVLAGHPGTAYRIGRFVRRHRRTVAAASVAITVAGSAALAAGLQARRAIAETERARRESQMAEEISRFVVDFMTIEPRVATRFERVDAETIIDTGARNASTLLDASPVLRAQLLHAFGDAHRRVGRLQVAAPLLEEAVRELDALTGATSEEALAARDSLARLRQESGEFDEAERLFREGWEVRRAEFGELARETLHAQSRLGLCLKTAGHYADAEVVLSGCFRGMEATLGSDAGDMLIVASYHVGVLLELGRYQEALDEASALLPRARSVLGARHVETLVIAYNLACALVRLGRLDEAADAFEEPLEGGFSIGGAIEADAHLAPMRGHPRYASIVRREHLNTAQGRDGSLWRAYRLRCDGRLNDSEVILREVVMAVGRAGEQGPERFNTFYTLADVLFLQGRIEEAEAMLDSLEDDSSGVDFADPPEFAVFRAQCRAARGDRTGARSALAEALAQCPRTAYPGIAAYAASREAALAGEPERARALLDEARARGFDLLWWLPREIRAVRDGRLTQDLAELERRLPRVCEEIGSGCPPGEQDAAGG